MTDPSGRVSSETSDRESGDASNASVGSPRPHVRLDYAGPGAPQPDALPRGVGADAVALGALMCVPFVTGAMSVAMGIAAARRWGVLSARERVLTLVGLSLGATNTLLWVWMAARVG